MAKKIISVFSDKSVKINSVFLVFLVLNSVLGQDHHVQTPVYDKKTRCYDDFNRPQRCIPEFGNAAFNVLMEATNTCGEHFPIEYCVQTGTSDVKKSCEVCRQYDHDSRFLTDLHNNYNATWWQSETMLEGVQFPSQVNLTLHLGKAYDITYVRILFYSPRPESFSIYKRTNENEDWVPYQFYSATCRDTYHLPDTTHANRGEETRALCTSEYSDISPLRDGVVAFSTLEGRPSAFFFDSSPELQEWVTATDIRISLDRLNTFGEEVFGDQAVLRSYFYAIADVAVGARCKCNGHASECVTATGLNGERRTVCRCEHNTAGPDCNECLPFYNDVPWARATNKNAHECKPCNCNGFSNRCFFDKDLYNKTGHGGHCLDCSANRDGPNCERCKENYYQREDGYCIACDCDPLGSRSLQCNREGKCQCKPGVTGDKCDRCDANHYDFGTQGCKECGCLEAGSRGNRPTCDPISGVCLCKENVEGRRCRECKPGFFHLDLENDYGCTPCFCYGHSAQCQTASGYSQVILESMFTRSAEKWIAEDEHKRKVEISYNTITQSIGVQSREYETVYFLAPDRFLGDQRASYNKDLKFVLRIGENAPNPTAFDVVLEGSGTFVSNTIFGQNNPLPSIQKQEYTFRLHEYGWQPRLNARSFMSILTNLTAIRIRGTYTPNGVGFLDDIKLQTAIRGAAGLPAQWVEKCECPHGYVGQFCESCAPGFRHSPALGGPFMPCIPCDCNKHAEICDSETGRCICQHNTAGDNCELCARGYYGNALEGSPDDCKPCNCPGGGACMLLHDDQLVCLECPEGYAGPRCDLCSDGYYGDPTGKFGPMRDCYPCECNQNVDKNAVGICNRTTGECLKCIHNTGGFHCDECLPGYYGDALSLPKGDCKPCTCFRAGTEENPDNGEPVCDQNNGNCRCKPHVKGHNCDQCQDGYFNILSGEGCSACNCDPTGSLNHTCDLLTGQCHCQPGITGLRCDQCEVYKYGFSSKGCTDCECDRIGSQSLQCDPLTGQCPCLENVEGRKCDRCKENKYDRQRGCVDCEPCYNLVQDEVHKHVAKLKEFERKLNEINTTSVVISDKDFDEKLQQVQKAVEELASKAKTATGEDEKTLTEKLNDIRERQKQVSRILEEVEENIDIATERGLEGLKNVSDAGELIEAARQELNKALELIQTDGKIALDQARERSKEIGQQNEQMTNLAQEARELADQLDEKAEDVEEISKEAKEVAAQAMEQYKLATNRQNNISLGIDQLRIEMDKLNNNLMQIEKSAMEAQVQATEVENKTIRYLLDVKNLVIPDYNITALKENAEATKTEALRILEEVEKLTSGNEDLLDSVKEQIERARDILENAQDIQLQLTELKGEADLVYTSAKNAVELGDDTLNEAQNTYNTLSDFDREVQASKHSAEEAMKQIPEIQKTIDEAKEKTENARQFLIGAEENANKAKEMAQMAQSEYADKASKKIDTIRTEANELRTTAQWLKDETENLAGRVSMTEQKIHDLEDQTTNNATIIDNAKKKVSQASADSKEASEKVALVMQDVQAIIDELNSLPDIQDKDLEDLERKLSIAEEKLRNARLDERMERLEKERLEQTTLIKNYQKTLERLQEEVKNVENIMNALPTDCYRKVRLEP